MAVLVPPCAIAPQHVDLPWGQGLQRRVGQPGPAVHQRLDHDRVDHRPTSADLPQCPQQRVEVADAVLQEVGEPGRAAGPALVIVTEGTFTLYDGDDRRCRPHRF
jgi:hypothetical protein